MRGVALPAPPVDASLYRPGQMKVSLTGIEAAPSGNASRLLLLMQTPWPAWGLLNVTGPVIGWSFAQENPEVELKPARGMLAHVQLQLLTAQHCS